MHSRTIQFVSCYRFWKTCFFDLAFWSEIFFSFLIFDDVRCSFCPSPGMLLKRYVKGISYTRMARILGTFWFSPASCKHGFLFLMRPSQEKEQHLSSNGVWDALQQSVWQENIMNEGRNIDILLRRPVAEHQSIYSPCVCVARSHRLLRAAHGFSSSENEHPASEHRI
jgi:hypothetical protein